MNKNYIRLTATLMTSLGMLAMQGCNDGAHVDMCSNHQNLCRTNCGSVKTALDKYKASTEASVQDLIARNDATLMARIEELRAKIPTFDTEYAKAYDACQSMPFTAYKQQGDGVAATADNQNEACSCYSSIVADNSGGTSGDASSQEQQNLIQVSQQLSASSGVQQLGATNAADAASGLSTGAGLAGTSGSGTSNAPNLGQLLGGAPSKASAGASEGASGGGASGSSTLGSTMNTSNTSPSTSANDSASEHSLASVNDYAGGSGSAHRSGGADTGTGGMDLSQLFGGAKAGQPAGAAANGLVQMGTARRPASQPNLVGTPDREDYFSMNGAQDDLFQRNTRAITTTSKRW